jgi:glycosyltransferase involved in cell wall biosynthesis
LLQNVRIDARTVYIGVDLEKIRTVAPAEGMAGSSHRSENSIIYAGGLHRFKGIFALLEALLLVRREVGDVSLLVAGDGPERESVSRFIRASNLAGNVKLLGAVSHQDMISHMKSSRLVIVPSIQPEAASRVAIEALACGKPILGSNRGAVPEIIGNAGVTFDPEANEIARSIIALLKDRAKIERLGSLARERSLKFSIPATSDEIVRTYREWLGGPS